MDERYPGFREYAPSAAQNSTPCGVEEEESAFVDEENALVDESAQSRRDGRI